MAQTRNIKLYSKPTRPSTKILWIINGLSKPPTPTNQVIILKASIFPIFLVSFWRSRITSSKPKVEIELKANIPIVTFIHFSNFNKHFNHTACNTDGCITLGSRETRSGASCAIIGKANAQLAERSGFPCTLLLNVCSAFYM